MASANLSQRGKAKFTSDGYIYVFDRVGADQVTEFWRCEKRRQCKARVHVKDREIVKFINVHSHAADAAQVEKQETITKLKSRAAETVEETTQVINECVGNLTQACQGVMPTHGALRKLVRRKRKEVRAYPANPTNLEDLVIDGDFRTYESENFLLGDSGDASCRIIIFGRQRNTTLLKESRKFFVDGTFKITPPIFSQVFVILAEMHGGIHPVLYALLPNKLRSTYDKLFSMVLEIQPECHPEAIYCDFEVANFKSLQEHFPTAEIRGFFFHLTQNLHKRLTSFGLSRQYNNDADFALKAKMISALAFVPMEYMTEAIENLADELPDELQVLLDWFEDNYVGRRNRRGNGRRAPLFPQEMWNVYERSLSDEDRTNNHAEAAHRRLQNELGMQHPTVWKFIDGLKKVQRGIDLYYEQLIAGQKPPVKLKKYRQADERIKAIVSTFESRNVVEYLRGIAHNLS